MRTRVLMRGVLPLLGHAYPCSSAHTFPLSLWETGKASLSHDDMSWPCLSWSTRREPPSRCPRLPQTDVREAAGMVVTGGADRGWALAEAEGEEVAAGGLEAGAAVRETKAGGRVTEAEEHGRPQRLSRMGRAPQGHREKNWPSQAPSAWRELTHFSRVSLAKTMPCACWLWTAQDRAAYLAIQMRAEVYALPSVTFYRKFCSRGHEEAVALVCGGD